MISANQEADFDKRASEKQTNNKILSTNLVETIIVIFDSSHVGVLQFTNNPEVDDIYFRYSRYSTVDSEMKLASKFRR